MVAGERRLLGPSPTRRPIRINRSRDRPIKMGWYDRYMYMCISPTCIVPYSVCLGGSVVDQLPAGKHF